MRTTATPVHESDVESVKREFFGPGNFNPYIRRSGCWFGGLPNPQSKRPLQMETFESWLLAGRLSNHKSRESSASPNEPLAWRIRFETDSKAITLWATGDEMIRTAIEESQHTAIRGTLNWLQKGFLGMRYRALFALFQSGATEGCHYLHTDVFISNPDLQYLLSDRKISNGTLQSFESRVAIQYATRYAPTLQRELEAIDYSPATSFQSGRFQEKNAQGKVYETKELFSGWREQAKTRGRAEENALAVIRKSKEAYVARHTQEAEGHKSSSRLRNTFARFLRLVTPKTHDPQRSKDKGPGHSH
jgi:hypothetical protein